MSTVIAKNVQVGTSATATNNFTWYQPASPDGTVRLGVGNTGATSADVMTANSSGNVGIGTSSPGYQLALQNSGTPAIHLLKTATSDGWVRNIGNLDIAAASGGGSGQVITFSTGANYAGLTERARIDGSGNLLVGLTGTSAYLDGKLDVVASGGQPGITAKLDPTGNTTQFVYSAWAPYTTGNNVFMSFETETSATIRGSISYNRGVGLVAYNTTSDYRAKNINGPVEKALATVAQLKPYMGVMKGATIERPMFIAHETQAIAPYSVVGEKDAVNEKGDPILQQMDHSTLVPLLTAAIQELNAKVEAQAAEIAALKAA